MTLERWQSFSKSQQLLMLGSEIVRAKVWQNQPSDKDKFLSAIERALELIDLTLNDRRWQENFFNLLYLRDELVKFFLGLNKENIEILLKAL